jgi:hypothetical protein
MGRASDEEARTGREHGTSVLKEHIAKLRAKQNSYMEVIAKFTIQGIL